MSQSPSAPSNPEVIQALEDLARAINAAQENICRVAQTTQALIGGYDQAPTNENALDSLQTSNGITSAVYNMAQKVEGLGQQIAQQADILTYQLGSPSYFLGSAPKASTKNFQDAKANY